MVFRMNDLYSMRFDTVRPLRNECWLSKIKLLRSSSMLLQKNRSNNLATEETEFVSLPIFVNWCHEREFPAKMHNFLASTLEFMDLCLCPN
jgi:hypothetical protein